MDCRLGERMGPFSLGERIWARHPAVFMNKKGNNSFKERRLDPGPLRKEPGSCYLGERS